MKSTLIYLFILLNLFISFSIHASETASIVGSGQITELVSNMSSELQVLGGLTLLSFIPILIISMTAFLRIVIVLSLLRHALGVQQTPPNMALIALALFLTFFTMSSTINQIEQRGVVPYKNQIIGLEEAISEGYQPLKYFMISQTREADLATIINLSDQEMPASVDGIKITSLVPAFMLSELTTAFKIAFVIFIPFLLIDLIVATVLMSLGMIMLPPITVALPLKIMLFVLIDGWSLLSHSLISSFKV